MCKISLWVLPRIGIYQENAKENLCSCKSTKCIFCNIVKPMLRFYDVFYAN